MRRDMSVRSSAIKFLFVTQAKARGHLGFAQRTLDYKLHLQFALRAIRYANVRFGILPRQSGFRRNDGEEQTRRMCK